MFWIILAAAILIGSVVLAIIWRDEDFVFFGVLTAFLGGEEERGRVTARRQVCR